MSRKSFWISAQDAANIFVSLFHCVPLYLALPASYEGIAIERDLGSDLVSNSQMLKVRRVLEILLVSGLHIDKIFGHSKRSGKCC
jgi:hypothetical protein